MKLTSLMPCLIILSATPALAAQYEYVSIDCKSADGSFKFNTQSLSSGEQEFEIYSDMQAERLFQEPAPVSVSLNLIPNFIDLSKVKSSHTRHRLVDEYGAQAKIKEIQVSSNQSETKSGECNGVVSRLQFKAVISVSGTKASGMPSQSKKVICEGRMEALNGQCA